MNNYKSLSKEKLISLLESKDNLELFNENSLYEDEYELLEFFLKYFPEFKTRNPTLNDEFKFEFLSEKFSNITNKDIF